MDASTDRPTRISLLPPISIAPLHPPRLHRLNITPNKSPPFLTATPKPHFSTVQLHPTILYFFSLHDNSNMFAKWNQRMRVGKGEGRTEGSQEKKQDEPRRKMSGKEREGKHIFIHLHRRHRSHRPLWKEVRVRVRPSLFEYHAKLSLPQACGRQRFEQSKWWFFGVSLCPSE